MMSVHVNPGMGQPSIISSGNFELVGDFWVDFLGRASVATLSFLSGYLLVKTASSKSWKVVARDKFNVLIIPMIIWNSAFIILHLCKTTFFSGSPDNLLDQNISELIASFTGINGPTANLSLFFLRDIFVALILVKIGMPVLAKWPVFIIFGIFVVTLFDLLEPLIFRPSIFLFVGLGAFFALRNQCIADILNHKRLVVYACATLLIFYFSSRFFLQEFPAQLEIENLAKRLFLVILMLATTAWMSETILGDFIVRFEENIFETYLSHLTIFGVFWTVYTSLGASSHDPSYLVFFFLMPLVAIIAGSILGRYIDMCPVWLQKLLRGRARASRLISATKS